MIKTAPDNRTDSEVFPIKRLTCIVVLSIALSASFSGCGGGGRNVLSFLFDGVPNQDSLASDSARVDSFGNLRQMRESDRKARMDSIKAANRMQMHTPYADKDCSACHTMPDRRKSGGNLSFNFGSTGETSFMKMPVETLCFSCHEDKSPQYAEEQEMTIHSPVEEGECLACHHPHRSRYSNLLLKETARELCMDCHDESIPAGEEDHPELEDSDDCTDCHNPHMSEDEFLLN
jgi:predicted CXXCH cytochrome family protein